VYNASTRVHARPLLQQLQWLPVASRIQYKLCVLMSDTFHGSAPYCTGTCWNSASVALTVVSAMQHVATSLFREHAPALCRQIVRCGRSESVERTTLTCKDTFRKHLKTHFLTTVLINHLQNCFMCFIVLLLYGANEHR